MAAISLVSGPSLLALVSRELSERFARPIVTHRDPKSLTALCGHHNQGVRSRAWTCVFSSKLKTTARLGGSM